MNLTQQDKKWLINLALYIVVALRGESKYFRDATKDLANESTGTQPADKPPAES